MEKTEHKVLVANRGEIAVRIVQACRKLGLEFVCVHTAEDIHSGHVRIAKELGGEKSLYQVSSYHDANEILSVADDAGATAIHPGYGFFAEDFRFARRVTTRERKLIFIGPSWRVIRELGDKINTKTLAAALGRAHGFRFPTAPFTSKWKPKKSPGAFTTSSIQQGITRPLVLVKASAGAAAWALRKCTTSISSAPCTGVSATTRSASSRRRRAHRTAHLRLQPP